MRRGSATLLLPLLSVFAALFGLTPAAAAPLEWGATVQGRAGYGTNPFLADRGNGGSGLVGFSVAPVLTWREPKATTELSAYYNRDQYFSRYDHTDDFAVDLRRTDQWSARLTSTGHVGYYSQISGLLSSFGTGSAGAVDVGTAASLDPVGPPGVILSPGVIIGPGLTPGAIDQLAVGTRQQRLVGDVGLSWQPTARDNFRVSGVAQRVNYNRFGADYSYLGGTVGYLRTLTARTRVGADFTIGHIYSSAFPDTTSYQPNLTIQQTVNANWTLNAGVGAIITRERRDGRSRNSVGPGFNASLCGTYPRLSMCLTAARAVAPSGFGGLRRQTQFGVDGTYRLSERSRAVVVASYGTSDADDATVVNGVPYGDQRFGFARLEYQRDVSRRVSAGVAGSYQARSGRGFPEVHALAITFNLTARFGHMT